MNNSIKIDLLILLFLLSFGSCKESTDTNVLPPVDDNLILNPSFESESGPSLAGWSIRPTTNYAFSADAVVGGGSYSLIVRPVWRGFFSFNAVMTRISLPVGNYHYRVSCWAKRLTNGAGSLSLFVGAGNVDTMTATVTIPVVDTIWTFYSAEIFVKNQSSDSVVVAIHGGYSHIQYPADSTFFDLCKFERLD